MAASITTRLQQEFDSRVRTKGNSYYYQRRVNIAQSTPQEILAKVQGNGGKYLVALGLSDAREGVLKASCTCPYFEGNGNCKHIWATILQSQSQLAAAPFPPHESLIVEDQLPSLDDDESDPEDEDEYEDYSYKLPRQLGPGNGYRRAPAKPAPPPPPRWRTLLDSVLRSPQSSGQPRSLAVPFQSKARQTWFVLDITSSLSVGHLVIELRQREKKKNGEFGGFKKLAIDRSELKAWHDPEEAELLVGLITNHDTENGWRLHQNYSYRYSYGGYESKAASIVLLPLAFNSLLPRLCQSGRFLWALSADAGTIESDKLVSWDDGPAWRFRLVITTDEAAKEWIISGQLTRDGSEPLQLKDIALLVSDGLVLHEGKLARLDASAHFPWIVLLRKEGSVRVPFTERTELLKRLWRQGSLPEMELCESLRLPEQRPAPRGVMRISTFKEPYLSNKLRAALKFNYDGREIPWGHPSAAILDDGAESLLVRDLAAEQQLLRDLPLLGFKDAPRYYDQKDASDLELPAGKLASVVDKLSAHGWTVEAEGRLIRRPGEFKLTVTSGVDWFGLDGEFDFGGVMATLPELLAAVRKGEKYVKLGDGTQGILPEEWLAKFGNLAALGSTEEGEVRFKPSQALLLDALLASQPDVTLDKQFSAWRKKLQSFQGIKPRNQPRGFVGTLRDYQRDGLGWLHFLREFRFGGCLADDMGLGKTIQVLSLLQSLKGSRKKDGDSPLPSLVVVPRSLVFNWMQEAAKFSPQLKVLDFAHKERGQQWDQLREYDLVITTYGTLIRDIIKLKDIPFEYAILDEAQAIKNAQSQSAKACRLLTAKHRLAMSGTPIENHLGELWSLFEFLNPGMLGQSEAFRRFSTADVNEKDRTNLKTLSKAIAPFVLRRTKGQVLKELPEKTEQTIYCDLSPKERKQYDQLREYYRLSLTSRIESEGLAKSKIHVLEALLRLRQAACHSGLLDDKKKKESSAKLDVLLEQLEEIVAEGHKVLVFSQFTKMLDIVRTKLDGQKVVYEYLDGKTRDRQVRVDRFQSDPACPVFLVSLKAGGRGLNLTAADYVFILDPWWNPAVEAQAVDRAHRIGQTRRVFAYRLIARDTVEEKILELQSSKRDLADAIISADGSLLQNLTAEDLRALLS
ncbi:MAG: DEAD/DEAH box helicase [Planctomycetales bacterium]|nr:DEAD/DEAH box helicase [Planctomycetales bacterium]